MIDVELALPRRCAQLRVAQLGEVAAFHVGGWAVRVLDQQRAARPSHQVDQRLFDQPDVVDPQLAAAAIPDAEVEPHFAIVQAVEDDVMLGPFLVPTHAEIAVREHASGRVHGKHPRTAGRLETCRANPRRSVILAPRPDLDELVDAAVAPGAGRVFDPQRRLAAVPDGVVRKRPGAGFVLETPAGKSVSATFLEIPLDQRLTAFTLRHVAVNDKRRLPHRQRLGQVGIVGQNPGAVAEAAHGGNDLQLQFPAQFPKATGVLK